MLKIISYYGKENINYNETQLHTHSDSYNDDDDDENNSTNNNNNKTDNNKW